MRTILCIIMLALCTGCAGEKRVRVCNPYIYQETEDSPKQVLLWDRYLGMQVESTECDLVEVK